MAPIATSERASTEQNLKQEKVFNPFYSPSIADDGDASYKYAGYKVSPCYPLPFQIIDARTADVPGCALGAVEGCRCD